MLSAHSTMISLKNDRFVGAQFVTSHLVVYCGFSQFNFSAWSEVRQKCDFAQASKQLSSLLLSLSSLLLLYPICFCLLNTRFYLFNCWLNHRSSDQAIERETERLWSILHELPEQQEDLSFNSFTFHLFPWILQSSVPAVAQQPVELS